MICTTRDGYLKSLIQSDLMISWKIILTDGTIVYGDYDRPGFENPWFRLKEYCKEKNVVPKSVELHMFGAPKKYSLKTKMVLMVFWLCEVWRKTKLWTVAIPNLFKR